jgi:glucosamine--fructose-6-phosphate aminotransferase (isomerizing)
MKRGQFTRDEIFTQDIAWAGALREIDAKSNQLKSIDYKSRNQIIFTGCGSTFYLSLAAASIFQSQTGVISKAVPGGELLMNPEAFYTTNNNVLFAISRSGATSETVEAAKCFKEHHGGLVVSISNYDDRPLTQVSDITLCIREGQEQSVAQTRAFSSMFIAAAAIAMIAAGRNDLLVEMTKLPEIGRKLIHKYQEYAKSIGENLEYDRFYFLGSGCRYGLACEANLKMKEMTITHTEPFHFLEFRHGPISMVNEQTVVLGLVSESKRGYEEKVLVDVRELGAQVVSLAEADGDISFESNLSEDVRNVLYLPLLQVMAFYRALKKGLDPDKPKNLEPVVYLV